MYPKIMKNAVLSVDRIQDTIIVIGTIPSRK